MKEKNIEIDNWVLLSQSGNTDAFSKIYDEFVKPIYRYIFYKVDESVVEDLTEEVFFKAWKNIKKYKKGKFPFSSWLFKIAHNLVVDYYRKYQRDDELDENFVDSSTHSNPEEEVNIKLTQIKLRKVIKRLPEKYKQIVVLKYINDLNNKEISIVMGKSEPAVRTLQFRALNKLKVMLNEDKK